jgi:uncharacterized protein YkwD
MVLRYATVILGAVMLATLVALSVSAVEPKEAEAAIAVRTCGGESIALKAKEERTLRLHNQVRRNHGLRSLCVNRKLTKAARAHSADMIRRDYFGHGPVGTRLTSYGYRWSTYGENIAGGSGARGKPKPIFGGWMKSSHHRANILNGGLRQIGVGTAKGDYRGVGGYTMYTVDFGRRR